MKHLTKYLRWVVLKLDLLNENVGAQPKTSPCLRVWLFGSKWEDSQQQYLC